MKVLKGQWNFKCWEGHGLEREDGGCFLPTSGMRLSA